jgi:HSP20 family protein
MVYFKLSCRIKNLRKINDLTQEELADSLGISRQALVALEAGKSQPNLSLAADIASFFSLPIELIFKNEGNVEPSGNNKLLEANMNSELTPWRPFLGMRRWQELMDKMWEDESWENSTKTKLTLSPAIDVYEKNNTVFIKCQLPGFKPEEVDINVTYESVSIKGEKKEEKEEKEKSFYHQEISYGTFFRSVILPARVKAEKAEAKFSNGILTISMPKLEIKAPKTIKIQAR